MRLQPMRQQSMRLQHNPYFLICLGIVLGFAGCRSNPADRSLGQSDGLSYAIPDDFQQSMQAENEARIDKAKNQKKEGGFLRRFSLPLVYSGRPSREKSPIESTTVRPPKDDSLVQMTPSTINRWKVFGKMEQNFRSLFFSSKETNEESLVQKEKDPLASKRSTSDQPARLPLVKTDETPILVPPPAPAVGEKREFEVLGNNEKAKTDKAQDDPKKKKSSFKNRLIELWPSSSKR